MQTTSFLTIIAVAACLAQSSSADGLADLAKSISGIVGEATGGALGGGGANGTGSGISSLAGDYLAGRNACEGKQTTETCCISGDAPLCEETCTTACYSGDGQACTQNCYSGTAPKCKCGCYSTGISAELRAQPACPEGTLGNPPAKRL